MRTEVHTDLAASSIWGCMQKCSKSKQGAWNFNPKYGVSVHLFALDVFIRLKIRFISDIKVC